MPLGYAAAETYKPAYAVLHQIFHLSVNADGTSTLVSEVARQPETPQGVRWLGEGKVRFRDQLSTVKIDEAWSITPEGARIDVPADSIRVRDDDRESDGANDSKVAVAIYPGIQVGSKVHMRSTRVNHTTPYPGHFTTRFIAAPRLRVDHFEVNLVHPESLPLRVMADRLEGGRVPSRADDPPGSVRYRFHRSHKQYWPAESAELEFDDWAPSLMVSTFTDYAELAREYQRRAAPRAEPDAAIRELANSLVKDARTDRERVARLREWINRNVRYLGVHFGVEGWIPHPAPKVLDTRYGDCKDQTALMQAMLKAVGIDNTAVLVNTESKYQLPRLPLAGAFDHVIVHIPSLDLFVDLTDRYAALGALPESLYGKPAVLAATGQIVHLPLRTPERDFVETTVRMQIDEDGRASGTASTRTSGVFEGESRSARQRANSESEEEAVNEALARYDESGSGRISSADPLVHGEPWLVQTRFELEPVVNLPGPSAMRIPVGLTRADLRAFANWKPLVERRNPFSCSAGRWRDNIEIILPASAPPVFVPGGVAVERGAFRYHATWQLEGTRLKVIRELIIERDRGYCVPQDERDFIPVREAMRRDLMGQVVFGLTP
jgi:hypothetical protein